MTREERRELLGAEVVEYINRLVDEAPAPPPEVVKALRRIFTNPLGAVPAGEQPTAAAA
jgi:hypothetical protein